VPLSEHEQRMLDQIERALYAEDPKFASTVRGARLRRPSRRRRLQGAVLFIAGIALLLSGLIIPIKPLGIPVVSVIGFLTMFLGAVLLWTALRHIDTAADTPDKGDDKPRRRNSFAQRMEERFRRRFEE
jgi:hypothetical protein